MSMRTQQYNAMQMPLFDRWIDGRKSQPADGQKVLVYNWIEDPDDELPMFKKMHISYNGIVISGPSVRTYEKKFVESGDHRKVALWQPIDELPNKAP